MLRAKQQDATLGFAADNGRYEEATSELKHWFSVTNLTEAEMIRSKLDEEVLESLGYTQ